MVGCFRRGNFRNEYSTTGIYREELTIEDGLIKAHRLVIPTFQRAEYLEDLHAGLLGKKKTLSRVRETVVWPGISVDVRNEVKTCGICRNINQPSRENLCCHMMCLVCHEPKLQSIFFNIVLTATY